MEYPLPPSKKPLRPQTGKPKPRSRPRQNALKKHPAAKQPLIEGGKTGKKAHAEDIASEDDVKKEVVQAIVQTKRMRIDLSHDPKPKTDLGGTSGKNPLGDGLVNPAREFAKSVTKTSSKVREPKTYDEAINDLIHGNKWREAVGEELWNLDIHQTWCYTTLLPQDQKTIGCKQVFRVKYNSDSSIKRYKARLIAQGFFPGARN